jgi:3-deoxy-D-manno-octulosonate 8-phosphate phosphatase (KDO 8-P phosphatase)
MILMDVDGVMTDGRIHVSDQAHESRSFDVKDGHGIRMGQQASLEFAIISGRRSALVEHRAAELGITEVHQRILDKSKRVREIVERLEMSQETACFIGDDLIDLPAMRAVGLAVATADAVPQVLEAAHYVTCRPGGRGAVREVVDLVLQAGGHWDEVTRRYYE